MPKNKQLNDEELEKVSGGSGFTNTGAGALSGFVDTSEAYNCINQNFFIYEPGSKITYLYVELTKCEEERHFIFWTKTRYYFKILDVCPNSAYKVNEYINESSASTSLYRYCRCYKF